MTTWYPRDATAYRRPNVRGAKKLHRARGNGTGLSLCGDATICDDEPGMAHEDPPVSACCKKCWKFPTHKEHRCINCEETKPCLLIEATAPAEYEDHEDWHSDSSSRVTICRECLTQPSTAAHFVVAGTLVKTLLDGLP